jgi:hypothetical protein
MGWSNASAISRLLLISTFIASLTVGTILTVGATITTAGPGASDGQSQELGSVEDYLEGDPSFTGTYKVPLIGIEVSNGRSETQKRRPAWRNRDLSSAPR